MQASQISQRGTAHAQVPGTTFPPGRILVVDDDRSIRQINTEMLSQSGYEVDAAEDGAVAWDALNAECYDLLITDNQMPKVTGIELLKKLRAARMEMPVIMATGTLPTEEFTRHPWLQPAATLVKPYSILELLQTVKKVLGETGVITATAPARLPCEIPRPVALGQQAEVISRGEPREILLADVSTASAPPITRGKTNSPPRILVVDEDSHLRLLYTDVLTRPGYAVDAVEDGATAWETLRVNRYDLLITEHELPTLTGVELVRKLRAARMAVPVVMAAARLPMHELARSPALHLAATLVKPFAVDALLNTVNGVLRAPNSPRAPREILLADVSTGSAAPISRGEPVASPPNGQSQPSAAGWQV